MLFVRSYHPFPPSFSFPHFSWTSLISHANFKTNFLTLVCGGSLTWTFPSRFLIYAAMCWGVSLSIYLFLLLSLSLSPCLSHSCYMSVSLSLYLALCVFKSWSTWSYFHGMTEWKLRWHCSWLRPLCIFKGAAVGRFWGFIFDLSCLMICEKLENPLWW